MGTWRRPSSGEERSRRVAFGDPDYPPPLRYVPVPPPEIWIEGGGDGFGLRGAAVAVVGSRDATAHGLATARALGRGLAEAGIAVVSGLALGIDAAAHQGALEAGGATVAVVGSGTDVVYPWANRRLRQEILERGRIVGEWPPGTRPRPHYFPRRNRIISGLCLGVVVVEATTRSGALRTARFALEQGREVFAVPGPAGAPRSAGPHRLLKAGACLVETVHDILEELPLCAWGVHPAPRPAAGEGARLVEAIAAGAATVDAMALYTGRKIEEIWAGLLALEVRGEVVRGPAGRFGLGAPAGRGAATSGRPGPGGGLDSGAGRELGAPPQAKEERWPRTS